MAWQTALENQECGSSNTVCIEHFTPEDYKISKNGKKITLNAGAVPTIFDVFLIEIDDDGSEIDNIGTDLIIPACCAKLREEHEKQINMFQNNEIKMKSKIQNDETKMRLRIGRILEKKRRQERDIRLLKKQVEYFRKKLNQKQKKIDEMNYIDLQVIFSSSHTCHIFYNAYNIITLFFGLLTIQVLFFIYIHFQ